MESRQFKHERYLEKLEKHIQSAQDSCRYSSDRFDILLVSLSTTALLLSMAFAKNLVDNIYEIDPLLLKIAWILFGSSLVLNLLSQVTGYYSNVFDIKLTTNLIRMERGNKMKGNQKKNQNWCTILNYSTQIMNGASLLCLVVGIILLLIFFTINI